MKQVLALTSVLLFAVVFLHPAAAFEGRASGAPAVEGHSFLLADHPTRKCEGRTTCLSHDGHSCTDCAVLPGAGTRLRGMQDMLSQLHGQRFAGNILPEYIKKPPRL